MQFSSSFILVLSVLSFNCDFIRSFTPTGVRNKPRNVSRNEHELAKGARQNDHVPISLGKGASSKGLNDISIPETDRRNLRSAPTSLSTFNRAGSGRGIYGVSLLSDTLPDATKNHIESPQYTKTDSHTFLGVRTIVSVINKDEQTSSKCAGDATTPSTRPESQSVLAAAEAADGTVSTGNGLQSEVERKQFERQAHPGGYGGPERPVRWVDSARMIAQMIEQVGQFLKASFPNMESGNVASTVSKLWEKKRQHTNTHTGNGVGQVRADSASSTPMVSDISMTRNRTDATSSAARKASAIPSAPAPAPWCATQHLTNKITAVTSELSAETTLPESANQPSSRLTLQRRRETTAKSTKASSAAGTNKGTKTDSQAPGSTTLSPSERLKALYDEEGRPETTTAAGPERYCKIHQDPHNPKANGCRCASWTYLTTLPFLSSTRGEDRCAYFNITFPRPSPPETTARTASPTKFTKTEVEGNVVVCEDTGFGEVRYGSLRITTPKCKGVSTTVMTASIPTPSTTPSCEYHRDVSGRQFVVSGIRGWTFKNTELLLIKKELCRAISDWRWDAHTDRISFMCEECIAQCVERLLGAAAGHMVSCRQRTWVSMTKRDLVEAPVETPQNKDDEAPVRDLQTSSEVLSRVWSRTFKA